MFVSKTPKNINGQSYSAVLECIDDDKNKNSIELPSPRVRLNYAKLLYDVLGYDLSTDLALAMTAEPKAMLVLATAGGGKTTWSQIKAIQQKLLRPSRRNKKKKISGDSILCLVYNKHNIRDMETKHKCMIARLRAASIQGLDALGIDDRINACTLHSFCDGWRKEFVLKLGLLGYNLIQESESNVGMRLAIETAYKLAQKNNLRGLPTPASISTKDLLALHSLTKHSLKTIVELEDTDKFVDLGLSVELISLIFERFDRWKQLRKKYDYTDMLYLIYQLMMKDSSVKEHIQGFYEYVIADEVQDFTPLMWAILRLMVDNGTPLTCIGDEDQNIYNFNGADIFSTLHFDSDFNGGEVYLLNENRRCGKEILDTARNVIEQNTLRFDKKLNGRVLGGCVEYIPYNTQDGQFISIINKLNQLPEDDLADTVICYRNSECSALLAEFLEEHNIRFNVLKGKKPLSHELYKHVLQVLDALEMSNDREVAKYLYKVLPISKAQMFAVLDYIPEKKTFREHTDPHIHFSEYDYGRLVNINGFTEAMGILKEVSLLIQTAPLNVIFPRIFSLLCRYFWDYKKSLNNTELTDTIFEERVIKFFHVNKTYNQLFHSYAKRSNACGDDNSIRDCITLSTFHKMKGLEFKHVIAVCMSNDIFPNFPLIDSKGYTSNISIALKESETRLWYVVVTRAKESLTVYYDNANPSKYVTDAIDYKKQNCAINLSSINEIEMEGIPITSFDSITSSINDFEDMNADDILETEVLPIDEVKFSQTKVLSPFDLADSKTPEVNGNLTYFNRLLAGL